MRLLPASLPARIGAVAAAAVIAATGSATAASAAVTAPAAPALGKVLTALSIGVSGQVAGSHVTTAVVGGRLFEPREYDHGVRGKVVWLLREGPAGHWIVAGQELTGPHGGVAFTVHVVQTASFRLAFDGAANFTAAISTARTIS
jgi:hypothetical protein